MTAVEPSPMGATRERPVRCLCGRSTWNHSGLCNRCRKQWAPEVRVIDALWSVVEMGSAAPGSPAGPAAAADPISVPGPAHTRPRGQTVSPRP